LFKRSPGASHQGGGWFYRRSWFRGVIVHKLKIQTLMALRSCITGSPFCSITTW
jgi:hypothetical protein